jgi:sugar phosphate isomerase/epimerase
MSCFDHQQIFVSTSGIKCERIGVAVRILAEAGFRRIELSGGTRYHENWFDEVAQLGKNWGLQFRLHGYFPPPFEPFVLNLASEDEGQFQKSLDLVRRAIQYSAELKSDRYGFHAGFLSRVDVAELGGKIQRREFHDSKAATDRFNAAYDSLKSFGADFGVEIYVENNVLSTRNFESFGHKSLFLMTSAGEMLTARESGVRVLLDVGHLKVSCRSLRLNFRDELLNSWEVSDYIHLSDNDGLEDRNWRIGRESELFHMVSELKFDAKSVTLEIYSDMEGLITTYETIRGLMP